MTLRDRLRAATHADHQVVDQGMALMDADVDRAALRHALRILLGFARTVDPLGAGPWGPASQRVRWLEDDLRALGEDPEAVAPLDAGPVPEGDAALGWAYVVEGSAMGSRAITAHLARALPDWQAPHYFSRNAEAGGTRWRAFLQACDDAPVTSHDAAVAAAQRLFGALARRVSEESAR